MLQYIFTYFTYGGVAAVLIAGGFGLPLPEDLPLLIGGYMCADSARASLHFMIPVALLSVFGADSLVYFIGRRYGHHVPKIPIIRKYLTADRLAKAEKAFREHSGKTLFTSRFVPGLRSPAFFTAGTFRIPYWKMVVFDGGAALLSVPTLILLGYFFGPKIEHWIRDAKFAALGVIVALVLIVVGWKVFRKRKKAAAEQAVDAAEPQRQDADADEPQP